MRQSIPMFLGVLWALTSPGCARNAALAFAPGSGRPAGAVVRADARVLLVVTNLSGEAVGVYVLRAGLPPVFMGVAEAGRSAAFDATAAAPRGSRVRFAALARRAGDHLITDEDAILRGGTIVIEIESAGPRERRSASAGRAT